MAAQIPLAMHNNNNGEIIVRYVDKLSPLQILQIIWSFGGAALLFTILINNLRFAARLRRVRKPLETTASRIPVTDTIMVAAYDPAGQTLSVMSLPRHTAVMDGQRVSRLNDGCRQNIAVLQERVAALTGFTPDYYVQVNLDIVSQLVDLLGGVMFHVPVDMDYDDPYQNLHIHLRKGVQILDGEQAMGLVRYRWYREDNITREAVQQDFMKALLKECLDLKNWDKVMEYINLAYENAETDLEVPSIAWFAANILGLNGGTPLSVESVYTCTMPVEDEMKRVNGMAVVISRPSQTAELVNERFNPYQQEIIVSMLDEIVIEQS